MAMLASGDERVAEQCRAHDQVDHGRMPNQLERLWRGGKAARLGRPIDRAIDQAAQQAQG